MEHCVFCQAPCPPGALTCPTCGQRQPSDAAQISPAADTSPADAPMGEEGTRVEQTLPVHPAAEAAQEQEFLAYGAAGDPTADDSPHQLIFQEYAPQPQGLLGASPPPFSGARGSPGVPLAAPAPPSEPGATPPARPRHQRLLAIILVVLVVLGAGGTAAYILTRPMPVITVTGPEQSGALPAGAPDLSLQVTGSDFTPHAPIHFLLDGHPAPGAPTAFSDQAGALQTALPITDDWLPGLHTLTAQDAQGYLTKRGARLVVLAAPVLGITSTYTRDTLAAGSAGTILAYAGKRFALHSSITLTLDGKPLETAPPVSDGRGRFAGTLAVDASLALGIHSLSAQDAQGDATQTAASFVVVPQGEAGTPGPSGAPPDDLSFDAYASVSARDTSGQAISFVQTLTITGHPDPAGGSVCSGEDTGQPQTFRGTLHNEPLTFTEEITFACRGAYRHGHLTYVELDLRDTFVLGNGVRCASNGPYIYGSFAGTFTSATQLKGAYSRQYFQANCTDGTYVYRDAATGKWTGGT